MTNRSATRLFGIFFILTFLSYGIGTGMVTSVTDTPGFLNNIDANKTTLALGVFLMAVSHSFFNIALPVLLLPILKPLNERLAYGYLSAAIIATTIMAVGAMFFLLLIPMGATPELSPFASLIPKISTIAYHLGMALWSIGGLMFIAILYQSRLIPRFMSVWGIGGYVTLLVGSISELFAHNDTIEMISVAPGGLFEIALSLLLIFKGFREPQDN
ncbi:MAG: DUF4386 domain-containing protein [Paracoccaceae bacterium]